MAEAVWDSGPSPEFHAAVGGGKSAPQVAASAAEIRSALALPIDILTFPGTLADPDAEVELEIG